MATDGNERRGIRAPYTYRRDRGFWGIFSSNGAAVAIVFKEDHARWLCLCANFFDRLTSALNLFHGELESLTRPIKRPEYDDVMTLADDVAAARSKASPAQ